MDIDTVPPPAKNSARPGVNRSPEAANEPGPSASKCNGKSRSAVPPKHTGIKRQIKKTIRISTPPIN
jgi:hypothetical protein